MCTRLRFQRVLAIVSYLILITTPGIAERVGDHTTAGFNADRSYLNSNAGDFRAPLELIKRMTLSGVTRAQSLLAFDGYFLVGEFGDPVSYSLFDQDSGDLVWEKSLPGHTPELDYFPSVASGIVLLRGAATTGVVAVRISDGMELWEDTTVGSTKGRYPMATDDMVVYHGQDMLKVADLTTGTPIWTKAIATAEAPVSLFGKRVYIIRADGTLEARDLFTGDVLWSLPEAGGDGSNIIATEQIVFVNDPDSGDIRGVRTTDGTVSWVKNLSGQARPPIALAYGSLFVFSKARVTAYDANTGELRWQVIDPTVHFISLVTPVSTMGFPNHAAIANGQIFYFNSNGRLRVLDAFSGGLVWSRLITTGGDGLSVVDGKAFFLTGGFPDDKVEVYTPSHDIYFAQVADGGSTDRRAMSLLALTNLDSETAICEVTFFDDNGVPLEVGVEGLGTDSSFSLTIEPNGSARIQTLGNRAEAVSGWARVSSDRRISGTAAFQVKNGTMTLFEAGVSDSAATGQAHLFASRLQSEGIDASTAIAIANPSNEVAEVEITYYQKLPTELVASQTIEIAANQHVARFLEELFGENFTADTEGTLVIVSDVPVVITALRTQNGFQMSSSPVGQVPQ